jgi:hypothetical protein
VELLNTSLKRPRFKLWEVAELIAAIAVGCACPQFFFRSYAVVTFRPRRASGPKMLR